MTNENFVNNSQANDKFIVLSKEVYVLNCLAMGIAIQIIAQTLGGSVEEWKQHLGEKASEQYSQLSGQKIQQIIDIYEASRDA